MGFGSSATISLGRVMGVWLRIDIFVLILMGFWVIQGFINGGLTGLMAESIFAFLFFFSIFCHEFGHVFSARMFGIQSRYVTLTFFGGTTEFSRGLRTTQEEIVVSAGGPLVNLALAALVYVWLNSTVGTEQFDSWRGVAWRLCIINLILGVFNLMPGYPLDGGHIARAVLSHFMPRQRARAITGYIGVALGLAVMYFLADGFGILLGVLLIVVAAQEIQSANGGRW